MGITMTDQETHAIVGKTREDYRNAKKEFAALVSSAEELQKLSIHLQTALADPSRIVFFTGTPVVGPGHVILTDAIFEKLSSTNVKKLSEDMKRVIKTRDALRQRLIELEGEDPEGHSGPQVRW